MKDSKPPIPNTESNPGLEGYPYYPTAEDIYDNSHKESLDEEDAAKKAALSDDLASELDVPGAELDDADELTGNEDEENNYYSLGGDEHNNLDENDTK